MLCLELACRGIGLKAAVGCELLCFLLLILITGAIGKMVVAGRARSISEL